MILRGIVELQNGTDVRGVAAKGVPGEDVNLDDNKTMKIVYTFAERIKKQTGKQHIKLAIGRDSRVSGEFLAQAACVGAVCSGAIVYDCGLCTTPAMFMTTVDPYLKCDGAVMITASHLPANRNGIKFFTKRGGIEKNELSSLLHEAEEIETSFLGGKRIPSDFLKAYAANIVGIIRTETKNIKPLKDLHIVVDAGNGAGGFFVDDVLKPLGADTKGSQYLNPDGHFPHHIPNPENPEAMAAAVKMVKKNHADMGIIFDTDVDRSAIIDEKGDPINRNAFIAFISKIVLQKHPGSTIVTDSVTSTGLTAFIEKLGGHHHRYKRGYRNVINEAIRLNEEGTPAYLAMETSGHGALKDNYFLDDGAYLATLALIELYHMKQKGKPFSSFVEDLKEPEESMEVRYRITGDHFRKSGEKVLEDFKDFAAQQPGWSLVQPNYEGVRVNCDQDHGNGWCLMRLSLHEPKLPTNIESEEKGGCQMILNKIDEFLSHYQMIEK
ncbi:phosphomannomutase/phosphoglucomutase [Pseudoramibacter sp.]|jgi:phosphomannomutase|uniref:phosphomannomutase/phosphoglucomutase n=1 Tax=Pseudoramibacter sp. TaxID=2034862 RepID=UPI0025D95702|nr:phosphomannomutase/phosphoglucomutase [Pseudoramibacter sp.]MCH4072936.1 phosphomannomutase/phosphoglucomutase [Pseudoramibacter sp.]MCH4106707.1 phosphomannomutase/phosphoglucomutase [Pseudoramibacter sp.]